MNPKHALRRSLIEKRLSISPGRRKEASQALLEDLLPKLKQFSSVLSFASKEEEINLWPLNALLAHEKRLLLTKIDGEELTLFKVEDLELDLRETGRWKLKEPLPERAKAVALAEVGCVLVPGLGFDRDHHRIGYGLGHFDRFLKKLSCPTFGIGFKEQLLETPLPIEEHDISLTDVFLY